MRWSKQPGIRFWSVYAKLVVCGLFVVGIAVDVTSAEEPLVTDRPDQTESSEVVPKGTWQLEAGWSYIEDAGNGAHEFPGALLRVGVSARWELRLGWDGLVSGRADGVSDGELGAKVVLGEGSGAGPQVALLMSTSVPIGDDELTTDHFDPSFRLLVAHDLPAFDIAYNIGMAWETNELPGIGQSTASSLEYTIAAGFEVTNSMGAFIELFGEEPVNSRGSNQTSIDAGLTFALAERMQLDVAGGVGVTDAAPPWFVGVGLSVRWPH